MYQWYLNYVPIVGETNRTINVSSTGWYTVTVDSGDGCSNRSAPFEVYSLGAKNNFENKLQVYPNPSSGIIYVEGIHEGIIVKLRDISGKQISEVVSNGKQIELNNLSQGIYILEVSDGNAIITRKIVVR